MKICPRCNLAYPENVDECPSDHTPLAEAEEWHEGTVIGGKYRILAKISQDIACTVYTALQLQRKKFRILKVMNPHLASRPEFVKLFKRSARQLMLSHHPNVATVEGIEKTRDGLPFLVMEYGEGRNLKEIIQQEAPLEPLRACAIAKQIAAGLEAANQLGMIHRDLKPESIFVSTGRKEKVKLYGYGDSQLKELLVGNQFRTSPDTVIGTAQYLSPEQALGKPGKEVDGRTDIYSLGVILYEMLTRELPFREAQAADFMTAHIQGNPIPIRAAHADLAIPNILINMVTHCMLKDPKERPTNARSFILEVEYVEKQIKRDGGARHASRTPGNHKSRGWKLWRS